MTAGHDDHRAHAAAAQRRWRAATGRVRTARVDLIRLGGLLEVLDDEPRRLLTGVIGDDVVRRARAAYRAHLEQHATEVS